MDAGTTDLVRRLRERFPEAPEDEVRDVVDAAHRRLAGRPIQDFTPVLVERAAVEHLRRAR